MSRHVRIDDLHDLRLPEQPAISPDGHAVVYVVRTSDREPDREERSLWSVPATGGDPRRLTRGTADHAPAWSPDGTRVAFLRGGEGPSQVWVLPADGGEAEQVTDLPLGAGTPRWSPDGTRIAFTAPVDPAGSLRSGPVVADHVTFKEDGTGLLGTLRRHLHVVDPATGEVRQVTHDNWLAGDPAWSPDGTMLAFAAARDVNADASFRAPVHVVSALEPHARPRRVGGAEVQAEVVGWTPDGDGILAVGRTDTWIGHARLLCFALDGELRELCPELDRNVMPGEPGYPGGLPQLCDRGRSLVFCLRDNGLTHLWSVPLTGGEPRCLVGGGANVAGLSVAGSAVAVVLGTPTSYGEIALVDPSSGEVTTLTDHQPDGLDLFVPEERSFAISDGRTVHGWLVRDPEQPGPQPLLLDIHGGPHNAWNGAADPVHLYHQVLAAQGWTVLLLNPRGSDGYGEEFFTAVLAGWGREDARDFLEPIDQLVADGVADPERLAVTGYSYGGYMTCYLTSHDDRFAAAVAGGAISDLTSVTGTSDAGALLGRLEFGGMPWERPADLAEMSPLTRVSEVRTPTLLVHGADDLRCPVGQAEQWFSALRALGVPTRMVVYPGESHGFVLDGVPSHRADWNQRVVDWVQEHATGPDRPRRPTLDGAHWQRRLAELAGIHGVPGATLGILRLGDRRVLAHHGVLNTATGVEVTDDSLFQIGSITKVWTATVVMQLVEEGRLDLDAPIVEVLPELRLGDAEVAKTVTLRHLLTHSSGIDGDVLTDTGRGDDCLERYVEGLGEVEQTHPLGATFSYCNSGFVLAGRVIERITGLTWDRAIRERLFTPLGLEHTVTLPEEALMFRTAVGHLDHGDGVPRPAPVWGLARSAGPAGLIVASASDVLDFAALHLAGGVTEDGTRVLAPETVDLMGQHQIDVPDRHALGDSWGLGWSRFDWSGQRLLGHDGNTVGQAAFLRILPEQQLAVTLLVNGGNSRDLYAELFAEIFDELAGVALPEPFAPAAEPPRVDGAEFVGVYERAGARAEVFEDAEGLRMRTTVTGPLAELVPNPVEEHRLVPVSETEFGYRPEGTRTWLPVVFYRLPTGDRYLHSGVRAAPKVS